jgi:2-keto-3-deoxy-6-phosphogluconate aldolase
MLNAKHMPKDPQGQKRPADVIGNAVHVMRIGTGEVTETLTDDGKNAAAVALGRKGGLARAQSLSVRKRREIAKKAAKSRWNTKK